MNNYNIVDETLPNPIVSVAMLAYNHEKFIVEAIESVLMQQTNFPIQLVIAEDNSPDNTREVILKYQREYPKIIKLILQNKNVGVNQNNFDLLSNLEGKYVAALEGDDYWIDPLKLQKQVDFIENNNNYGLVYTDVDKVDTDGKLLFKSFLSSNQFSNLNKFEDFLILAPFRAPCTWLFRKDILDIYYLEDSKIIGDLTILLNISSKASVFFMRDVTANYRVLDSSASHFKSPLSLYLFNQKILYTQLSFVTNDNQTSTIISNFVNNNLRNYLRYGISGYNYFWEYRNKFNLIKKYLIILRQIF